MAYLLSCIPDNFESFMSSINPKKIAFVFPGQGSQCIGMGQEICAFEQNARNAFNMVTKECDFDLQRLAWVGPEEALKRTCYTQPALLATSAACLQALRLHFTENPLCVAGHSLGEITALWAAGVFTLTQAAEITVLRGQLMENSKPGSMAAVVGMDAAHVKQICDEYDVVIANYNTQHQQVISGEKEKVAKVIAAITELKGKVIPLAVGGAFHSPLMQEANESFVQKLQEIEFKDAVCPVIQNVDGKPYSKAVDLKTNLSKQMTSSVQWVETIENMFALGAECFIEIGSGKVLNGLIRKIDRSAKVLQVSDPATLQETLNQLNVPCAA